MHDDGRTLLDIGAGNYLTETANILRKHGAKTKKELEAGGK
jgi:hypothetical protein